MPPKNCDAEKKRIEKIIMVEKGKWKYSVIAWLRDVGGK